MKFVLSSWLVFASASALVAAQPLFTAATESKWSVQEGKSTLGTVTLLTSASGARAEFRPKSGPVSTFLGGEGKVWQHVSGGDVEVSTQKATAESIVASALLYRQSNAKYSNDAKGPSKVQIDGYTATRLSLTSSSADASNFTIRPKKSATSRLARLSGDLLGPSNTNVSATAGGRGAGNTGLKLKDGGDYVAVEKLEKRDAAWKKKLDSALDDFQKDGKVGKARENQ